MAEDISWLGDSRIWLTLLAEEGGFFRMVLTPTTVSNLSARKISLLIPPRSRPQCGTPASNSASSSTVSWRLLAPGWLSQGTIYDEGGPDYLSCADVILDDSIDISSVGMMSLWGSKRSKNDSHENDVRWQAVLDDDYEEVSHGRKSSEPIASFPEKLSEERTDKASPGDNVQIIRASVYLEDDDDNEGRSSENAGVRAEGAIPKVNSKSKLLDMDRSAVPINLDELEESPRGDLIERDRKICYGPELTPIRGTSPLTTFAHDVEWELLRARETNEDIFKFESENSLDIERELNELMGTLQFAGRTTSFTNDVEVKAIPSRDGSEINLAYESTETDETPRKNYWRSQRLKSKSFAEKCKFLRNGKQRLSMIEFGSRRKSGGESGSSGVIFEPRQPRFVRLAYDRSSIIEPRVTSLVSLPLRPQSAIDTKLESSNSSAEAKDGTSSVGTSGCHEDDIDWTWLEEAMRNLNNEVEECTSGKYSRVDAGCQTQSDQSWPGEEERMRDGVSSERDLDSTASCVTSECRAIDISGCCDEEMSGKAIVESSGPSGVSSWLRQSMRRVRHFNLGEPPRIRSAPPDSLRLSIGDGLSDSVVNIVEANSDRVIAQSDVGNQQTQQQQQRQRTAGNRQQRRNLSRTRPSSLPGTTPAQFQPENAGTVPSTVTPPEAQENLGYESDSTDRHPSPRGRRRRRRRRGDDESEDAEGRSPLGPWPHGLSSVLAGLGCTLGLFNISRFAILSVHFGSNFILQFLILSFILGVPLLAFHAALGQTLGAGPVDMWKISPLFQGIGIALLLSQALIGIYSVIGVSWMFVYFRDSFITKQDTFRWAESFRHYREDHIFATSGPNTSGRLEETVPDYLNGVVLQRHVLPTPDTAFGHLKFQLTFNLAVIWMIVFVSLSKGLRSYGKVVYVFSLVPVLGILVMSSKLLGLTPLHRGLFPQTDWSEFFLNAKSWISAATEVTLTWNLLGAATMQVASHNRTRKKLWRDVATITLLTLMVLILAAFLGNTCHQILSLRGYTYIPSSFEKMATYSFLRQPGSNLPPSYAMPVRHMPHASLVAGDRVGKPGGLQESGYQVVRLATELVPATLALLGGDYLSPFWAVLFYFTLILFGVAQQLAIWHCVITGIMAINAPSLKSWETTITFFTCAAGFVLGLPMTTEFGVFVVYFLDYCIGGGWWILLLTIIEICAVLMIRGRPYTGENISIALFGKSTKCISLWAIPMLTFSWNVIMPVALLVVCITIFKTGGYRDLWIWRCGKSDYWPLWTREVGVFVQVIPLICIPLVALIQTYRYLTTGPPDIFDRIANLYRPNTDINGVLAEDNTANGGGVPAVATPASGNADLPPAEDPPPKYTPPPSYSTATGARIAKMLRQSFRRSVRRIQSVLGPEVQAPSRPPPPDYDSVLVEMNESQNGGRTDRMVPSDPHNFTAADVVQVLRCSFRRTDNSRPDTSQASTTNNQTLVIPPEWSQ